MAFPDEFEKLDTQKYHEDIERAKQKELRELQLGAKDLHELVVFERFFVQRTLQETKATSHTPSSEAIMGGRSPTYNTGFITSLTLYVDPTNQIPIRELTFNGSSIVRPGDHIYASIPLYEEKRPQLSMPFPLPGQKGEVFYHTRDFKSQELAIELAIINTDGRTIGSRDRSIEYDFIMKK